MALFESRKDILFGIAITLLMVVLTIVILSPFYLFLAYLFGYATFATVVVSVLVWFLYTILVFVGYVVV